MYHLNYKKLNEKAIEPTRGTTYSAGYDLYATTSLGSVYIPSGKVEKIGTGIAVEIPEGFFGAIYPRSGLSTKHGLRLANCVGVIDSDYRGELIVPLYNDSEKVETVHDGDRIAQLVIIPYLDVDMNEIEHLSESERGSDGFGSTGI